MVLSEGTKEKIPSDTTGDWSRDRPTSSVAHPQYKVTLLYMVLLFCTLLTEISRQPIGPTYKGQVVQEDWPLKTETIGGPETSVSANVLYVIFQTKEDLIYIAANLNSAEMLLIIGIFLQSTII